MQRKGYVIADHRYSPGMPEEYAYRFGMPVGSGVFEADTLTCAHCKTVQIKNPLRTRERASCSKCCNVQGEPRYICDLCDAKRREPDYVHRPWESLVDQIRNMAK